jgi:hypothetical protein
MFKGFRERETFKDLDWRNAFKRAALMVAFWLVLIYVLSVAFPQSFNLNFESTAGAIGLALNGVFFFLFFTVFTAFTERAKKRRLAAQRSAKKPAARPKGAKAVADDEEGEPSPLKGRHNPNTSRKKATRRRR